MTNGIAQLKRLRGKGAAELRVRGRQELAKLAGRFLGAGEGEMSDRAFHRHIERALLAGAAPKTASAIVNRIRDSITAASRSGHHTFFPSLAYRNEIVAIMRSRFASELESIIDRADRAIQGRFDLLGFRNLSFGDPPDWLLEPISGKRASTDHWSRINYLDPEVAGDKKVTWELNRHQHFVTLGQAYWLCGDERYAEAFVAQATSWMDANPPRRGINWVSSLELAFRSMSWLWALHLFSGSCAVTSSFALRLLKNLIAQGIHLYSNLSHYFSPNTHLTGEALGLFYLGSALPELRCARTWRDTGLRIMIDQLPRQIRPDGSYFEQATYYHRYTADFYSHLLVIARAANTPLPMEVEETLARMTTHLMWITRPDGTSPLMGDDDGGRLINLGVREPDDFRDTIATAAALFGRGDWKRAAGDGALETLWLLGPQGLDRYDELPTEEPRATSRVFESSGCSIMRDGWSADASYALMDCGPHGSLAYGHSHADSLSIEFAALGRRWIVDPGTFTYTGDPELREWFRSTRAHSTVTVDGESQSVTSGPFSWKHVANTTLDDFFVCNEADFVEATHDGYKRLADPVIHTRTVINPKAIAANRQDLSLPSYLIIHDAFRALGTHGYEIRYHLAPGCSAFARENHVTVNDACGRRLNIAAFGASPIRARIIRSWVSRAYGRLEPSLIVVFESKGSGPQDFTTFVNPSHEGQAIAVGRCPMDFAEPCGFQVISGGVRDIVVIKCEDRLVKCGPLTARGRFAWARLANDEFTHGLLIGGQHFETTDGFVFQSAASIKHCALRRTLSGITGRFTDGATFELSLNQQTHKGEINGKAFEVFQPAMFGPDDSRWSVCDNTSEAIN